MNRTIAHGIARTSILRTFGLTGLVLASLAGCNNDPRMPPFGAQPDPIGPNAYPQVVTDPSANRFLSVVYERIIVDQSNGERPLAVQVPVRSMTDNRFGMQYEYKWFDAQGREVGKSGPMYMNMDPRLEQAIRGNAMTLAATNWRLELRLAPVASKSPGTTGVSSEP